MNGFTASEVFERLTASFADHEIEWRVARAGINRGRPWAQILAYIDARAARARLNAVLGAQNWRIEYCNGPCGGVLATLSLRIDGEWISKQDGAEPSEREPVKGALSGAFKRACAVWGIGEHLYSVGDTWAVFSDSGTHRVQIDGSTYRWDGPALSATMTTNQDSRIAYASTGTAPLPHEHQREAANESVKAFTAEAAGLVAMPFGKHRGRALGELPLADLLSARDWAVQKKRPYPAFMAAVELLACSDSQAA